ncbi:MAG: alpha/beta hydrolase [Lactobacillaceae bacterium]|jgi:pimeloyl-ACP methyl ester carboxylesterase|nr:alpha/beta hydrolase [Lactobacillaceae bacterium]
MENVNWPDFLAHQHQFQTNDNVTLAYGDFGPASAQPIVLVGGYSSTQATWCLQVGPLVAAGYRVITFDRRNHGESQQVTYGKTLARHAVDLAELLAVLEITQPILIGHSMGVSCIWSYINLYTDANVKTIISLDSSPKVLNDETWSTGMYGLTINSIAECIQDFPHLKLTAGHLDILIKRELGESNRQPFDFSQMQSLLLDSLTKDWRPVIGRITTPTLLVGASESSVCPASHVDATQELNPKYIKTHKIYNSGHLPHLEQSAEVNRELLNFLTAL